tara:strand:- start:314 stop:526 length:213 start_codon:yes stop_codon:yes gene_type:complete
MVGVKILMGFTGIIALIIILSFSSAFLQEHHDHITNEKVSPTKEDIVIGSTGFILAGFLIYLLIKLIFMN